MLKEIKFALFSIRKNLESSTELRASFIIAAIGMILNNSAFILIWYIFGQIASGMNGWRPEDIFGLLGFSAIGFGIVFAFFGGVNSLPALVLKGDFDKYLLSPKNVLLRISTSEVSSSAVGDIAFGLIFLVAWIYMIGVSPLTILFTLLFILSSTLLHYGFLLFSSTVAFYFDNSESISRNIFELFLGPSLFQGGAIQGNLRKFFIFIVPALLAGTYPVEMIKEGDYLKFLIILGVSLFWLVFSVWFFNRSLKKYESSNYINFG